MPKRYLMNEDKKEELQDTKIFLKGKEENIVGVRPEVSYVFEKEQKEMYKKNIEDYWEKQGWVKNNSKKTIKPKVPKQRPLLDTKILTKFFPKDFFELKNNKTDISKTEINDIQLKTNTKYY